MHETLTWSYILCFIAATSILLLYKLAFCSSITIEICFIRFIFWVLASKVRRPQTGSVLNKQSHSLGLKYLCWHGNHLRDFSGLTFSKAHFYLCMTDRRIYCTSINQRSPVFRCNVHFCVFACMFLATCFCLIKRITI